MEPEGESIRLIPSTKGATHMEEALFKQLSLESFRNSQNLYDEAVLLVREGHSARAVALAVIGSEEFAKAVVYVIGALLPEVRSRILEEKGKGLRTHEVKHLINLFAEAAQIENHEGWLVAQQEGGYWPNASSRLEDMLISLGRKMILDDLLSKDEAKKYYRDTEKESPSKLKEDALFM